MVIFFLFSVKLYHPMWVSEASWDKTPPQAPWCSHFLLLFLSKELYLQWGWTSSGILITIWLIANGHSHVLSFAFVVISPAIDWWPVPRLSLRRSCDNLQPHCDPALDKWKKIDGWMLFPLLCQKNPEIVIPKILLFTVSESFNSS